MVICTRFLVICTRFVVNTSWTPTKMYFYYILNTRLGKASIKKELKKHSFFVSNDGVRTLWTCPLNTDLFTDAFPKETFIPITHQKV